MKKGFWTVLLLLGMVCAGCGAQQEGAEQSPVAVNGSVTEGEETLKDEETADSGESDGYREYVMSWWGEPYALSVKVPEEYLNENSNRNMYSLPEQDLDAEKVREDVFIPLPHGNADILLYDGGREIELSFDNRNGEDAQDTRWYLSQGEYQEFPVHDLKDAYTCQEVDKKEDSGGIKQFFLCENGEETLKRVTLFADMDEELYLLCRVTSREEGVELEDLEKVLDSLIFSVEQDKRIYGILDNSVDYEKETQMASSGAAQEPAGEGSGETAASEENASGSEPEGSVQASEQTIAPPEVYPPLDYPDDDWRCAGFYLNGELVKLPLTWDEFAELGYDTLCSSATGSSGVQWLVDEDYSLKPYHYIIQPKFAYNEAGEGIRVFFVNVEGETQVVWDCVVYQVHFYEPPKGADVGGVGKVPEDVKLCNGVTWGDTYEEVVELMGEPDEILGSEKDEGFSGSLTWYMEEGNRKRYVELHFHKNVVNEITINALPIAGTW